MNETNEPRPNVLARVARAFAASAITSLALITSVSVALGIFLFSSSGYKPNDIGYQICFTIGVGCMAALISGLIDRHHAIPEFDRVVCENLRSASEFSEALADLGLRRIHTPPFAFEVIFAAAGDGDEIWWLDTYCPRKDEFLSALERAIARGVTVRMLIVDPSSRTAEHRSSELVGTSDTGATWTSGLADFRARMEQVAEKHRGKFEIRQYDDLPGLPMYIIVSGGRSRRAFFSLYLSRPTAHFVHFELEGGSLIGCLEEYFAAKWTRCAGGERRGKADSAQPKPAAGEPTRPT